MTALNTGAAALVALGALIALANWWSLYRSTRTGRFHSPVPLVGAALLGAGLYLFPATRPYCWAALLLDYGTLALLAAVPRLAREFWSTSPFNLDREYLGEAGIRSACLRLFRGGAFTLRLTFRRLPGELGLLSQGTVGTWQREGARLTLRTEAESAVFDIVGEAPAQSLRQAAGFASWEGNAELSLAELALVQVRDRRQ